MKSMAIIFWFAVISSHLCFSQSHLKIWDGPTHGPSAQPSKKIVFLASDFKNGGVVGVYRGFEMASKELKWNITLSNGNGDNATFGKIFSEALNNHPDGIILGGFQVDDFPDLVKKAHKEKIILVGWHASAKSGPTKNLFVNIATDAAVVAKMAAEYVIKESKNKAGVIIFNDSRFAVANAKTNKMKEILMKCKTCKILSIEDIAISKADEEIPDAVIRLNKKFGRAWTHTLAINDVYFDNINYPLKNIDRTDIVNISAGDGSNTARNRILSGLSQQVATIAEPLNLQGWQLADELNRAFAGQSPSGYVSKPLLLTMESLKAIENNHGIMEMDVESMEAYKNIWKKK